jgi:hypothetical protein
VAAVPRLGRGRAARGRDLQDLFAKGKPTAEATAEIDTWLTNATVLAADPRGDA